MHPYWAQFAKLAVAHLLAAAAPGPDFAMVVRQSLAHGRRAAVWTSIGIGTAILIHVTYAVLGIGVLLRQWPPLFTAVKLTGAAYLAWIGARALMSRPNRAMPGAPAGAEAALSVAATPSPRKAWVMGFLTNATNPKVTIFFVAVFAALVDPLTPRVIQAAYGAWMSLATMAWFVLVSLFFTRGDVRSVFLRGGHWIDRAMGAVFLGLAAALAFASV
ncbi:MAG TPA: LysE family transporter [Opitutaceae bacterium]